MKKTSKLLASALSAALVASMVVVPYGFAEDAPTGGTGAATGGGPGGGGPTGGAGGGGAQGMGDVPVADGTNWTIPTTVRTNVVTVDGKDYKVITTSGTGPVLTGPDWLGVSSDVCIGNINGLVADTAATQSLEGIFASVANEVPNAYAWNEFYNLYTADSTKAELTTTSSASVNSFNAATGTYQGFQYRPEVLWGEHDPANIEKAASAIRNGQFYTSADTPIADDAAEALKAPYDDQYNPTIVPMSGNGTVLEVSQRLYELVDEVEKIEASTASYDGTYGGNKVTAANATWLSMNALPRTTRYEASTEDPMSARDCALAFEQVQKGAVFYALSQINAGTVKKKKVAFVSADPDADSNTATISVLDCADGFTANNNAGFAGLAPLAVEQLVTSKDYVVTSTTYVGSGSQAACTATADELATCDVVVLTGSGGTNGTTAYTQESFKQWMVDHCTSTATKAAAEKIQYDCISCTQAIARNKSIDKSIYTLHTLDFVYPELFPNMELETYWYDRIFHITEASLTQSIQWGLGVMSLPEGANLANVKQTYSKDDMDAKFYEGYNYYVNNSSTDTVLANLKKGYGQIGDQQYDFSMVAPTATYAAWAADYAAAHAKKAQTIKITKNASKTVKSSTIAKKKTTFNVTISGAQTALTATLGSGAKKVGIKVTVNSKKKLTVTVPKACKTGTYKITVKAKATTAYKASAAKTITIKVSK
ncbi:MAG: hypothetical protein ACI36Y_05795 [Coriobacteriales bacterium]